jgi:hypothetical protein
MTGRAFQTLAQCAGVLGVLVGGAVAVQAADGAQLMMNGKVVSANVMTINGQSYVSLQEIAKAFGMVVAKGDDGNLEIKKPGGTEPVQGLEGKIGDVLFDGKWRFQVFGLSTPASYLMKTGGGASDGYYAGDLVKWDSVTHVITPGRGYQLVVLQCRVTNAVAQKRTLWVGDRQTNTALTDTEGESHPAIAHDFEGAPIQSKPLIQGSKLDFNLVFSVPRGTKPKDLIFTLVANGDLENPRDVRVSLTEKAATSTPPDADDLPDASTPAGAPAGTPSGPKPAPDDDDLPDANAPAKGVAGTKR